MKFGAFLQDRAAYIAVYVVFGLLCIAVVQLDLSLSGASLDRVNIGYILLLGWVGLFLFLLHEYRRHKRFYGRLLEVPTAGALDAVGALSAPQSNEQRLIYEAWQSLSARLQSELAKEREQAAERIAMISQWAHHMKTPVAVIDLELQKAAKLPAVPKLGPILASIAEENDRLDALLQMLLNLNRLDEFAADLKAETVDLLALARQVLNDNRRAFIAHRVYPKIEEPEPKELSAALLTVQGDAKWLRLVLEQIVSNAIKYAARPDREGRVYLRFQREGADLVLEVVDDGVGIAPEDLPRVFEPFFTGANGRMNARSTGMGLYLAREACRRLGHGISVASTPGEGTRVRLRFTADSTIHAGLSPAL